MGVAMFSPDRGCRKTAKGQSKGAWYRGCAVEVEICLSPTFSCERGRGRG